MERKRTLSVVNVAFIALIAITALMSGVNFIWLTEIVRRSVRTARLARELVEGYRRLEYGRDEAPREPAAVASRHAALAAKSDELAQLVGSTARHSTRAMACVAISSAGTIVAGAALMALVTRRIARPLKLLVEATDRLAHGDLAHRVAYQSRDEMGTLADALNRMAGHLERTLHKLAEQKQAVAQVVERAIEHLESFNRSYGYEAGDLVVAALARTLRATAGDDDFVARCHGVRFAVLMPGRVSVPDRLVRQVEAAFASIRKTVRYRTHRDVGIAISYGCAQYPAEGASLYALLDAASRGAAVSTHPAGPEAAEAAVAGAQAEEPQ
jgi:diguanylate cyclase (GGDEF)-like protein